ncbi:hypothetical protein ACLOJK_011821 [Asimina triloba]
MPGFCLRLRAREGFFLALVSPPKIFVALDFSNKNQSTLPGPRFVVACGVLLPQLPRAKILLGNADSQYRVSADNLSLESARDSIVCFISAFFFSFMHRALLKRLVDLAILRNVSVLEHGVVPGYCNVSSGLKSNLPEVGHAATSETVSVLSAVADKEMLKDIPMDSPKLRDRDAQRDPSNGRVMLIDGTAMMYRAYYKLLGAKSFSMELVNGMLNHFCMKVGSLLDLLGANMGPGCNVVA